MFDYRTQYWKLNLAQYVFWCMFWCILQHWIQCKTVTWKIIMMIKNKIFADCDLKIDYWIQHHEMKLISWIIWCTEAEWASI